MEEAYSKPGWGYHIAISDNGKEVVKFGIQESRVRGLVPNRSAHSQDRSSTYVLVMDRNDPDKWIRIETPLDEVAGVVDFASDPNSRMKEEYFNTISIRSIQNHTKPWMKLAYGSVIFRGHTNTI
ncbi:3986_t:CDS:2 [Paraglomus brasilianum]|uniref:3986_t:CDS:1 n=1 Tax=Paraglomus brasilianum TaxID=144538 RepID=A0A9N8YW35_9GLOM|nr:3986_t:CDS:2 [Paraglomus brasilianum]